MKREDVKNKIPSITEEQLNWIMQENGNDVNREKAAATALQTQLTAAQAWLLPTQMSGTWHRLQGSNLPLPVLETGALPT